MAIAQKRIKAARRIPTGMAFSDLFIGKLKRAEKRWRFPVEREPP
jgi:hypothetical protein